jgi:hypothetical protein
MQIRDVLQVILLNMVYYYRNNNIGLIWIFHWANLFLNISFGIRKL